MDKLEIIDDFFNCIKNDPVIGPVHIALYMALYHQNSDQAGFISIERESTMRLSKIGSPATYFRKLRELSERGLIEYYPSKKRSLTRVSLKKEKKGGKRPIR